MEIVRVTMWQGYDKPATNDELLRSAVQKRLQLLKLQYDPSLSTNQIIQMEKSNTPNKGYKNGVNKIYKMWKIAFLKAHPTEHFTNTMLASLTGFSRAHIQRLLNKDYHITERTYRTFKEKYERWILAIGTTPISELYDSQPSDSSPSKQMPVFLITDLDRKKFAAIAMQGILANTPSEHLTDSTIVRNIARNAVRCAAELSVELIEEYGGDEEDV